LLSVPESNQGSHPYQACAERAHGASTGENSHPLRRLCRLGGLRLLHSCRKTLKLIFEAAAGHSNATPNSHDRRKYKKCHRSLWD
jgi:hypothetical protein